MVAPTGARKAEQKADHSAAKTVDQLVERWAAHLVAELADLTVVLWAESRAASLAETKAGRTGDRRAETTAAWTVGLMAVSSAASLDARSVACWVDWKDVYSGGLLAATLGGSSVASMAEHSVDLKGVP